MLRYANIVDASAKKKNCTRLRTAAQIEYHRYIKNTMPCNTVIRLKSAPPISAPTPISLLMIDMLAPTAKPMRAIIKMNSDIRDLSTSNATTKACRSRKGESPSSGLLRNDGRTRSKMSAEPTRERGREYPRVRGSFLVRSSNCVSCKVCASKSLDGVEDLHRVCRQQCMAFYTAETSQQPATIPCFRIAISSTPSSCRQRYQVRSTARGDTCDQPFRTQQGVVQIRNRCSTVVGFQPH
jgi:hypothetical protein